MKKYEAFWIATLVRGVLALFVGSVIVVPDLAATVLILPFAIAFSILGLAVYWVIDSAIVFTTSFMTSLSPARLELRLQGAGGILLGILFFSFIYENVHLHWCLYLLALQALFTACSEFIVARHTSKTHGSRWVYAAAIIALVGGTAYAIIAARSGADFSPREMVLIVYAYLAAFGIAQCLTAARILYDERHSGAMTHATSR